QDEVRVAAQRVQFLLGRYVPEPYGPVLAGPGKDAAVGAERHAPEGLGASAEGVDLLVVGVVPDRDRPVAARRGEQAIAAVSHPGERPNPRRDIEGFEEVTGLNFPELDGPVVARRGETRAVGAERQIPGVAFVAGQWAYPHSGGEAPDR